MTTRTIRCKYQPTCTQAWTVDGDENTYGRESLVEVMPEVARHLRDVHGDEQAAIRCERWAITPPPWTSGTTPTQP